MNETLKSVDIDLIQHIIPRRYPFFRIYRVIEIDGTARVVEIKSVARNRPQLTGHFPGMPVFWRVYMVEAIGAAAANGSSVPPTMGSTTAEFRVCSESPV